MLAILSKISGLLDDFSLFFIYLTAFKKRRAMAPLPVCLHLFLTAFWAERQNTEMNRTSALYGYDSVLPRRMANEIHPSSNRALLETTGALFTEFKAETDDERKWAIGKCRCSNDADFGTQPSFQGTESEVLNSIKNFSVGKSYPCILSGNKSVHSLRYFVLTGAF
jgi:hypothetical protein